MYYTKFKTSLCDITLVGDENGLLQTYLHTVYSKKKQIEIQKDWKKNQEFFKDIISEIKEFIAGQRRKFHIKLNLQGTDFQKKVWQTLCTIPYGETYTYQEIATLVGNSKASRAVGMANSKNPLTLIIPCHRVIGANGQLTGFASGIKIKEKLLKLERDFVNKEKKELR